MEKHQTLKDMIETDLLDLQKQFQKDTKLLEKSIESCNKSNWNKTHKSMDTLYDSKWNMITKIRDVQRILERLKDN